MLIGEQRGAGVKTTTRCFWDNESDSYATDVFMNENFFCVASAYGCFVYWLCPLTLSIDLVNGLLITFTFTKSPTTFYKARCQEFELVNHSFSYTCFFIPVHIHTKILYIPLFCRSRLIETWTRLSAICCRSGRIRMKNETESRTRYTPAGRPY